MIRRCAWCGGFMGLAGPYLKMSTTHGICDPCQVRIGELDPRAVTAAHVSGIILPAFLVFTILFLGIRVGAWWSRGWTVERSGQGLWLNRCGSKP